MLVLAGLAALRTRVLLLTDEIGSPIRRRVFAGLEKLAGPGVWSLQGPKHPRRAWLAEKLSDGWDCPWCLPFWLVAGWVGTGLAWGGTWPWQLLAGSLGVSYVVSHVTSRLDPLPEE